jgi:hypothetical protein
MKIIRLTDREVIALRTHIIQAQTRLQTVCNHSPTDNPNDESDNAIFRSECLRELEEALRFINSIDSPERRLIHTTDYIPTKGELHTKVGLGVRSGSEDETA